MSAPKVSTDIRNYIVNTLGITPVTIDTMSSSPISQYAVIQYDGMLVKTHGGALATDKGNVLDEVKIQIMHRNATIQTARDNLLVIVDALDGLQDFTISSRQYTYISGNGPVKLLDKSEQGDATFIWECTVQSRR